MLAFAWAALALPLHAEKADRDKPLNIEAGSGRYDDLKQLGTFVGNVVVTKGTMVLRASQLEVQQSPDGYQFGVATGSAGQLASFRQKREGVDEYVEGQAERIEYDAKADSFRLIKQAVIRRYRGAALVDETAGNVIQYDNAAAMFSVSGGASDASSSNPGRVRAVLAPPGSVPAAAASRSGTAIMPGSALGASSPGGKH